MAPSTADIRPFINQHFNDEELDILCFDYFRAVKDNFTAGMTKTHKVQLLLEYTERHAVLPNLVGALARERPGLYAQRFPTEPDPVPTPAVAITRNSRQIFVSHAKEDAELAQRLATDLRGQGWQIWIAPNSIGSGERWAEAIDRGLEESGVFLLLLTPQAVVSRWVRTETSAAMELEHSGQMRLIPLDVQRCTPPVTWNVYQRVSFHEPYPSAFLALLESLDDKVVLAEDKPISTPIELEVKDKAKVLNEQALTLHSNNDYDRAISTYSEAISLDPKNALYYRNRGASYALISNYDVAIADFNKAIDLDSKDDSFYGWRGWSFYMKDNYDTAIADYTRAIKLRPHVADHYRWRGGSYHKKGDLDAAIANYTQAIKLDPNNADFYRQRSSSYSYKGNEDAAIADDNIAIRLEPNVAAHYYDRGLSYRNKGNYDAAIADYNQAIKLDSTVANYYYTRGLAYKIKNQKDKARVDFEEAHVRGDTRASEELAKL